MPDGAMRAVVFVHGLWFNGIEATLLRRRLARTLSARDCNFPYRSVRDPLEASAAALGRFAAALGAARLDLVGHSLGGLVILRMLQLGVRLPPGRAVLLGSPIQGSRAAESLARWSIGRSVLGRAIAEGVLAQPFWSAGGSREIGVIAGRAGIGLGRLVARLDGPNDGVVRVEETRLAGARDHLVVGANHAGLLFARDVAAQTAVFLQQGRFRRDS